MAAAGRDRDGQGAVAVGARLETARTTGPAWWVRGPKPRKMRGCRGGRPACWGARMTRRRTGASELHKTLERRPRMHPLLASAAARARATGGPPVSFVLRYRVIFSAPARATEIGGTRRGPSRPGPAPVPRPAARYQSDMGYGGANCGGWASWLGSPGGPSVDGCDEGERLGGAPER